MVREYMICLHEAQEYQPYSCFIVLNIDYSSQKIDFFHV